MEKFIKAATSDLLADAVPESLKNMLLVMETAGIFAPAPPSEARNSTPILDLTWEKLDTFLPQLMPDLFGEKRNEGVKTTIPPAGSAKTEETPVSSPAKTVKPKEPSDITVVNSEVPKSSAPAPVPPTEPVAPASEETPAPAEPSVPSVPTESEPPAETIETSEVAKPKEEIAPAAPAQVQSSVPQEPPAAPATVVEKPPLSPMDPPVVPSTFFFKDALEKPKFAPVVSTVVPPPPKIEPMPPPPPGIEPLMRQNFQPIQAAPTQGVVQPLINPKPVMPMATTGTTPLSSYFPMTTGVAPAPFPTSGNLLTAAFTPTIGATNTVFLGGNQSDLQNKDVVKK